MPSESSIAGDSPNGQRGRLASSLSSSLNAMAQWSPVVFVAIGLLSCVNFFRRIDLSGFSAWYTFDATKGSISSTDEVFAGTFIFVSILFSLVLLIITALKILTKNTIWRMYERFFVWTCVSGNIISIIIISWYFYDQYFVKLFVSNIFLVMLFAAFNSVRFWSVPDAWNEARKDFVRFFLRFGADDITKLKNKHSILFHKNLYNTNVATWNQPAFLLPIFFSASALSAVALFVQFGWATIGIASSHLEPLLAAAGASIAMWKWGAHVIFAAFCVVAALATAPMLLMVFRSHRPIAVRGAAGLLLCVVAGADLVLASYGLFADPFMPTSVVWGAGYGYVASLTCIGLGTLGFLKADRVHSGIQRIYFDLRYRRFWLTTAWILDQFPQPANSKGYVFLNTLSDVYTVGSLVPVLCRLRQLGWTTVIIDSWPVQAGHTGDQNLDQFFSCAFGNQRVLNFDWKIDWDGRIVEAYGLNFYHPIWEGLSRHFGRYTVQLDEEAARQIFREILHIADSALLIAVRIHNSISGSGKPVRIVGGSGQFVPNAVFNIFCREIGKNRDMHFVWLQQGYQTYYKDQALVSDCISLANMTKKWPYSNPYLAHKDDFEAWVAKGQDVDAIIAEARQWARTSRATSSDELAPSAKDVLDQIVAHRAKGGKVVCLFGKMVFDLSTPWEGGPAHTGLDDWLNHSVATANNVDDVLLLIKPHPYESRPEIAGVVEQYFSDLLSISPSNNVMVLSHHWFNLADLAPHIDLGVLWNGTSSLELGLHNVPVLMCSDWGPIDYPIGFATPQNRRDYESQLLDPASVPVPDSYQEKCALLLKYTASDEVMIPYTYCARPLTNKLFGPPVWNRTQLREFLANGDPYVDYAAERVL